ncbi:MAG TPA: Mur ligase domain-containing protein, partial [Nitrolancea sp.]|nr:Mur ligase domain-containing protein [Nitrolancea sp.]
MFTLADVLIGATENNITGAIPPQLADIVFGGAAIDSRLVQPGDLFVALRGEQHDGHRYVDA